MKWNLPQLYDKHIFMVGGGREGHSLERFLATHQVGIRSFIIVDQTDGPDYMERVWHVPEEERLIVKSSGVPPSAISASYMTTTQLFFDIAQQLESPIVGVTGTKGKSTTASLLDKMLSAGSVRHLFGGNIGIPMLDLVDELEPGIVVVLELSSFMLRELTVSPSISVITNLSVDHLDVHGTLADYYEAKRTIVRFQKPGDIVVCPEYCELAIHWAKERGSELHLVRQDEMRSIETPFLLGVHNRELAALAKCAASLLGVGSVQIANAIKLFSGLPHRLEMVGVSEGVTYIDDSIASQPDAAIAGMEAVKQRFGGIGGLVAGGVDRGVSLAKFVEAIVKQQPKGIALIGDTGIQLFREIEPRLPGRAMPFSSMDEAIHWLRKRCVPGDAILLSPGCPSYSLSHGQRTNSAWANYEERGKSFRKAAGL